MKIRSGFVSNSSSSSFICNICGYSYAGYDGEYDVEHFTCVNKHKICEDCFDSITKIIKKMELNEILEIIDVDLNDEELETIDKEEFLLSHLAKEFYISSTFCPICHLEDIPDEFLLKFLLKKNNISREDLCQEIRCKYHNLDELKGDL